MHNFFNTSLSSPALPCRRLCCLSLDSTHVLLFPILIAWLAAATIQVSTVVCETVHFFGRMLQGSSVSSGRKSSRRKIRLHFSCGQQAKFTSLPLLASPYYSLLLQLLPLYKHMDIPFLLLITVNFIAPFLEPEPAVDIKSVKKILTRVPAVVCRKSSSHELLYDHSSFLYTE